MNETVRMYLVRTTRGGKRVYHSYPMDGQKPLLRDIYLPPDGQLPDNTREIEVTVSSEERGEYMSYILLLSAATKNTLKYTPIVTPESPAETAILVLYTEKRPDLPPKLFLIIEPAGVR